ncbi:MAG: leucyl/phenylalanyl-tRNA--protein transferase [Deltaproteobacteria bacterium]|nr:leucyl/phenylalanyl-tRNA--protein transferase [Deltaproteobacteria bacterium]
MPVFRLSDQIIFPEPELSREDGLLAVGGDLSIERLILAYRMGIFPWYAKEDPILWWSPDPRLVLYPDTLHVSRSLTKTLKQGRFAVTLDQDFARVIAACAGVPRDNQPGTWITAEMMDAYCRLHEAGFAHSVEVWNQSELAGGLYGVSLGKCFFGESMFARKNNASKVGLVTLVHFLRKWSFNFIDCQVTTPHLVRLGAREISRKQFMAELKLALKSPTRKGKWDAGQFPPL